VHLTDPSPALPQMIVGSTGYNQMNGPSILMNGSELRVCKPSWNETKNPG
jgi:hypothetical protein